MPEVQSSRGSFAEYVENTRQIIPEIDEQRDDIIRGGETLIDRFQIDPEFFDDQSRSAIFTSLSLKTGRDADGWEPRFVENAAFLLAMGHSHAFPDDVANHKRELGHDAGSILAAVENFEDHAASEELSRHVAIKGLFNAIKERIGADTEPNIHVVRIGHQDTWRYYDLATNGMSLAKVRADANRLHENAVAFGKAINIDGSAIANSAFTIQNGDEQHIVVPQPHADVVLSEERGIALLPALDRAAKTEMSDILRHEYVHTQSPVSLNEDLFGSSLEERRAEWFSGDTRAYHDVKEFFNRLGRLTGKHITGIFDEVAERQRQGEPNTNLYEMIGAEYGIDMISELAVAQPDFAAQHMGTRYTKAMHRALGSTGEILLRHSRRMRSQ